MKCSGDTIYFFTTKSSKRPENFMKTALTASMRRYSIKLFRVVSSFLLLKNNTQRTPNYLRVLWLGIGHQALKIFQRVAFEKFVMNGL